VTVWGQGTINVNTANPPDPAGVICPGADGPRLQRSCRSTKFLMMVTMLRDRWPASRCFHRQHVHPSLQNKGPFGQIFQADWLEPVVFLSEHRPPP